ncbi:MAG TPA: hypothetical protein VLX61_07850 [Anaerolineales bacterium]|nr:hypothetical protein [Anaerolineales bacterium]
MKQLVVLIACNLPFVFSSCPIIGAKPYNPDQGILTDKPCKVPCWNGLTPGKSTPTEVQQFMNRLGTEVWKGRDI